MAVRGIDWYGSPAVARRIVAFDGGYPRIYGVGDSLCSSAYSATDATNTAIQYGIVNTWRPKRINGWNMLSLSQGDAYAYYSFYSTGVNYTPGDALPDALGTNLIPIPCAYTEFASNLGDGGTASRHYIESTVVSPRYLADLNWERRNAPMTARIVYLRHATAANMLFVGARPDPNAQSTANVDMAGASGIAYSDLAINGDGSTDTQPGAQTRYRTGIDETGTNLIHVMSRVFYPSNNGFEYLAGGIGGKTAAEHAGTTLYSDAALAELVAATESNVFMICVGANAGLGGSRATYKASVTAIIERYRSAAATAGIASPQFLLWAPWYNDQNTDADIDTMNDVLFEIAASRTDTLAINVARQLGDTTAIRIDDIHMSRAGSDDAAEAMWDLLESSAASGGGGYRGGRSFGRLSRPLGGVR